MFETPKDHLRNIDRSTAKSAEHLRNINHSAASSARSAAQNTDLLKGIAFTSSASMVFNGINAANSARMARTQEQQFALQQEQHAIQQAMAEQTARHEFSMWRQTPEGEAFVDWQRRAAVLVPFLRNRERVWNSVWADAIRRAQGEIPPDERQRFTSHPARLRQTGLKTAFLVSFALSGLFALMMLLQIVSGAVAEPLAQAEGRDRLTYAECLEILNDPDNFIMSEADCEAINPNPSGPIVRRAVPMVLFAGLGITFLVMRKAKQRAATADPTVENEAAARIAKWGFDPLTTRGAWYPWHESQGFTGYPDRIEHMVRSGPSQRPQPSQLIPLQVPTPWAPSPGLPTEVRSALASFQKENESFSP
ncbi:hypothetical protein A6A08_26160 [Nocardiopsis sp. TSRI0078]|uniref:hypothetical protein n=1 Tax=unclassified Nocardiopsis TaxID=2649073 RepID=UPI00093FDD3D|nr:hypothetical protein [Nocardiopsis sp. TSRI0078]OKI16309.1 hypothetical protein A6A08_26160 [Nocardiopsis sp. TSRI0078]